MIARKSGRPAWWQALLVSMWILSCPWGAAVADDSGATDADAAAKAAAKAARDARQAEGEQEFAGIHFGVGITLTFRDEPEVESAEVVAGVVRITDERTSVPRVMLETHYFFISGRKFLGMVDGGRWGWGPFLGLQNGEEEIINAIATGVMFGFKRKEDPKDTSSWNFGVGFVWDPEVKMLGDGIEENQPLPPGETEIRFKNESTKGYVLVWSFSF